MVHPSRIRIVNETIERGKCIIYLMTSARRTKWNHSLEHSINLAHTKKLPLVVTELLPISHRWANDRSHSFVMQGMADNRHAFKNSPIKYFPFIETQPNQMNNSIEKWMNYAEIMVVDDYPVYYHREISDFIISKKVCETHFVDGNGLMAMRAPGKEFSAAVECRMHIQKTIKDHLPQFPMENSLSNAAGLKEMDEHLIEEMFEIEDNLDLERITSLKIDHSVQQVKHFNGGQNAAQKHWKDFFENRLVDYKENRAHPNVDGPSGLSPYLHYGHLSIHQILADIFERFDWDVSKVKPPHNGRRAGWWQLPAGVEGFLDQAVTWREVGFNTCVDNPNYDQFESLPAYAKNTLKKHESDKRQYIYTFEEFENCKTHDILWNCAQKQLMQDGIIHNSLRMIWGKKILEWTKSPVIAMEYMVALNDKWALDGCDPNSYSGIRWVLGKFDKPWDERPIYGTVRYMTSDKKIISDRKYKHDKYVEKYYPNDGQVREPKTDQFNENMKRMTAKSTQAKQKKSSRIQR